MRTSVELQDPIVLITSRDPDNHHFGTGCVLDDEQGQLYMLTCAHVVRDVGGTSQVQIQDVPAEVIAQGSAEGPDDLAVLRVPGIIHASPLSIDDSGETGQEFRIRGFYQFRQETCTIRALDGSLGKAIGFEQRGGHERIDGWDVDVLDEDILRCGYSGSPVVSKEGGGVVGVVSHRSDGGKKGIAISIRTLKQVWETMPLRLTEQFQEPLSSGEGPDSTSEQRVSQEDMPPQAMQRQRVSPLIPLTAVVVLVAVIVGLRSLSEHQQPGLMLTESLLVIGAVVVMLFSQAVRFYLIHAQKFTQEYTALSKQEFHWLIWPAIGANYAFERLFGKRPVRVNLTESSLAALRRANPALSAELRDLQGIEYPSALYFRKALEAKLGSQRAGKYRALIFGYASQQTRIRDLFTWRSVSATLLVSLLANSFCVMYILLSFPEDVPPFEIPLLRILGLSYLAFISFNFLGDLLSVSVTRHVVAKIVAGRCNFLYYLLADLGGIVLGYCVTLLPSAVIASYCWMSGEPLNQWIYTGVLGNALIPFFLFIFIRSNMPVLFDVSASIAIFSITLPTAIYLSLMFFCYLGYRVYSLLWKRKGLSVKLEGFFQLLTSFCILILLGTIVSELGRIVLQ